ncbi:hypothetical protein T03_1833, partial [Trichinella britovi]
LRFRNQRVQAKPADLPKHSLAKVEETTLHPGVGKVAGKVVIRAISKSQTNYAGSTSTPSSSALEWST